MIRGAYVLSSLYVVVTAILFARVMPWWAAILVTPFAIQVPIYIMGLFILPRWRNNLRANTWTMIVLLLIGICAAFF